MFMIGTIILAVIAIVMAMNASSKADQLAARVRTLEKATAAAKPAELSLDPKANP